LNSFFRIDGAFYANVENATSIKRPASNEAHLKIARAPLGDRGLPGEPFPAERMTPELKKHTPLRGLDPGHTARSLCSFPTHEDPAKTRHAPQARSLYDH
jgi:hypothetical protein